MSIVVKTGRENQALEKKRQVRVFYCDAVHLSLSELVVFSYRAYQDEYVQQAPHRKQVARAVGLSADTVLRADQELMRLGLLDGNLRARKPTDDLFRRKRKPDGTRHWRHGILSWTLFIRSPKCGLSPLSMAVWSYVAHCAATHWQPRGGLGASYLAVILRANRAAVQRVLGQLEGSGLLLRRDGCWCPVASKDWSWLADRWDGTTGAACRPSWQELPEGQEQVIPPPSYAETTPAAKVPSEDDIMDLLAKRVGTVPTPHLSLDDRRRIVKAILESDAWADDYYGVYLELEGLLSKSLPGTEWDVPGGVVGDARRNTPDARRNTFDAKRNTCRRKRQQNKISQCLSRFQRQLCVASCWGLPGRLAASTSREIDPCPNRRTTMPPVALYPQWSGETDRSRQGQLDRQSPAPYRRRRSATGRLTAAASPTQFSPGHAQSASSCVPGWLADHCPHPTSVASGGVRQVSL